MSFGVYLTKMHLNSRPRFHLESEFVKIHEKEFTEIH